VDAALLVVAADEGFMPQTREHLDILEVLGVSDGVVAVTKTDLVDDEWLEMILDDVNMEMRGRALGGAPVVPVSAMTGTGLNQLRDELHRLAGRVLSCRRTGPEGPMRLPIDRFFTVSGFGTVVTGTLRSGFIRTGDRAEILPDRIEVRVRGLQVHGEEVSRAQRSQRVAVNIPQIAVEDLNRGYWLAEPGYFSVQRSLAVRLRLLPGAPELADGDRVRVHVGTAEVMARVTILDGDAVAPGEEGLVRFRLEVPLCAAHGDRFIIRRYSPIVTIGGGKVLDIRGERYRKGERAVQRLRAREGEVELPSVLEQLCEAKFPPTLEDLEVDLGRRVEQMQSDLASEEERGRILCISDDIVLPSTRWQGFLQLVVRAAADHLEKNPLEWGLSGEELRSRRFRRTAARDFARLLAAAREEGAIQYHRGLISPPGHRPQLSEGEEALCTRILETVVERGYSPPDVDELAEATSAPRESLLNLVRYLVGAEKLVSVGDYFMAAALWDQLLRSLGHWFERNERLTVADLRDMLGTTRKYAVPLAEELDYRRVTLRRGDERLPGPALQQKE
jgi:selenocysteine-specific elongation factor